MTQLLEDALRKVGKLSEDEQNAIASQILEALEDEEVWDKMLRKNPAKLRKLAAEALEEHRRGKTRPLDEVL
jgi:DnaJ-domain-containing protein 1